MIDALEAIRRGECDLRDHKPLCPPVGGGRGGRTDYGFSPVVLMT